LPCSLGVVVGVEIQRGISRLSRTRYGTASATRCVVIRLGGCLDLAGRFGELLNGVCRSLKRRRRVWRAVSAKAYPQTAHAAVVEDARAVDTSPHPGG
jgi:hypothetical protein